LRDGVVQRESEKKVKKLNKEIKKGKIEKNKFLNKHAKTSIPLSTLFDSLSVYFTALMQPQSFYNVI
jgi:hypothetical protein